MLLVVLSLGTGGAATAAFTPATDGTSSYSDDDSADDSAESDSDDTEGSDDPEDKDEPQPLSRADRNEGGANGDCPDDGAYCSTRDGSASQNGKGDGKAKGKPCAGCVGKADNKNPRGQQPGGDDDNAGYECDDNEGVGKSNPAHTGCTDSDDDVDAGERLECDGAREDKDDDTRDEDDDCETSRDECDDDSGDDECLVAVPDLGGGGANAPAQPEVAGVEALAPRAAPQSGVLGAEGAAQPAGAALLPATGSPAALGLLAGLGTILLGLGTVALLRRRHA